MADLQKMSGKVFRSLEGLYERLWGKPLLEVSEPCSSHLVSIGGLDSKDWPGRRPAVAYFLTGDECGVSEWIIKWRINFVAMHVAWQVRLRLPAIR